MRLAIGLVLLALPALATPSGAGEVPASVTIVGSAEVKLTGSDSRGSARIVFAAGAEPAAVRLEVVRAGAVGAVVYCDAERLRVWVPGARPLLHETEPTRQGFESALGLPFCLDELLFALRAGNAPAPACEGRKAAPVRSRHGRVIGLEREGQRGGRPELLRFSRWRKGANGEWPTRAVLETEGSVATLLFGALRPHARAPLDLDPRLAESARRVDVAELRRALGLEEESLMTRLLAGLLAVSFVLATVGPVFAAESGSEDRLRRRVKRFYVLNYLNRYGEMWEMFSEDLRERLGGDRQDYVKSSRRSGFELYSSRIEDLQLKNGVAAVEVVVEAQLAGMLEVSNRRHRMLWRFEDSDWRYAGSMDITHESGPETPVQAAELLPPSRARAPEVEANELLPPRVRVETQPPASPARAPQVKDAGGERWDLVAVPPPGQNREMPATEAPTPATPAREPESPSSRVLQPETRVAEVETASPEWLPPELTSRPPPPPAAAEGQATVGSVEELDEGSRLVRKAVSGPLPRRVRALAKLRTLNEPRLAPLMGAAIPDAPPASAEAFLSELVRYRSFGEAPVVVRLLTRKEPGLRAAAARALIVLGDSSHAEALASALDAERDDAAFAQELLAYAAVAGAEAGPRIAATLADERAGRLSRSAAARSAGTCGSALVEEPLLALLRRERKAPVSRVGLISAGRLGTEGALALLADVAEQRLKLPSETADDLEGVLEASRARALASVPGAGDALALLVLDRGMRASSEDVVLVASTGDRDALLSLLEHPAPAIRRRSADLLGRVIETDEDAARALEAVEAALLDERDRVSLDALLDARERLEAVPTS